MIIGWTARGDRLGHAPAMLQEPRARSRGSCRRRRSARLTVTMTVLTVDVVIARRPGHGLVQSLDQPSPFEVVEALKPEQTPPPPPIVVVRHRRFVPVPRVLAGTRAYPNHPRAPFAVPRRWCRPRTATFQALDIA